MPLAIDACVAQHLGDRQEQQDRVTLLPHPTIRGVALVVVADGMGGHTGGALAAEQVVHTAETNLRQFAPAAESAEQLLRGSMLEAHTMIKASRFLNEQEPHSTAVMLLLQPGQATWAHCGDSRLYRFHDERCVFRTADHSYVGHLVANGSITAEQARAHPRRNVLLTSLGGRDDPDIAFGHCASLAGGDSYLLCSDGLWDYFSDTELAAVVAGHPARRASEILIGVARQRSRGKGDNLSLAIVKLTETPPAKPAGAF